MPQECSEEIEADLAGWRIKRARIATLIGEKNIAAGAVGAAAAPSASASASSSAGGRGKKKGGKGKKGGAKGKRGGGGKAVGTSSSSKKGVAKNKRKRDVDVTHLFGDTLQVHYRVEDISTSDSVTLLYNNHDAAAPSGAKEDGKKRDDASTATPSSISSAGGTKDGARSGKSRKRSAPTTGTDAAARNSTGLATFRQLKKLSKRIVMWVYPFDPANPTEPNDTTGGGFPRPEMIPLTTLFAHRDEEE